MHNHTNCLIYHTAKNWILPYGVWALWFSKRIYQACRNFQVKIISMCGLDSRTLDVCSYNRKSILL